MPAVAPHLEPADPRELALKYDRLAFRVALRYRHRLAAGSDFEDLAQVCRQAVTNAARLFDRGRGVKFVTYAWWSAARECEKFFRVERRRGLTWLGDSTARKRGRPAPAVGVFNEAHAEAIPDRGGRHAALAEIAVAPAPEEGPRPIDGRFWELATGGLTAKEAAAVLARYRDGLTLRGAGERMGLTRERVRQLCVSAVAKIREARSLDEFAG